QGSKRLPSRDARGTETVRENPSALGNSGWNGENASRGAREKKDSALEEGPNEFQGQKIQRRKKMSRSRAAASETKKKGPLPIEPALLAAHSNPVFSSLDQWLEGKQIGRASCRERRSRRVE